MCYTLREMGIWIGSQAKSAHLQIKRGFIHEGVKEIGKRRVLIHPVYFVCFCSSQALFNKMGDYLQNNYDYHHCQ